MMKVDAVLFDLDDTLLGNRVDDFVPRYFSLLSAYAASRFSDRKHFLQELMRGTQGMIKNRDRTKTNREVFWELFEQGTGQSMTEMEPFLNEFYESAFLDLHDACELRPVAALLVRSCFEHGAKVVIVTNPVFPLRAIEHRLAWAGLPVTDHEFSLVTSYENMHATKPSRDYYDEILDRVGVTPGRAIMVGDNWQNDIYPAYKLGMTTFWIREDDAEFPDPTIETAAGTLDDCYAWLRERLDAQCGHPPAN